MPKTLATVLVAVLLGGGAVRAQEWIRLESGKTLRGEIVNETDEVYALVDLDGERVVVKKSEVKRANRRPLKSEVAERLAAVKPGDTDAMMAVAEFAASEKKLKGDAPRIALRVVGIQPEHAAARALLGHVKALGHWYRDRKTANEAITEKMTADGFVLVNDGWVPANREGEYRTAPDAWMLVDGYLWRNIDEVMKERGFVRWEGEWYPPEEKDLVAELERLKKRTDQTAHAARVGSVEVYHVSGRDVAREQAEHLMKARTWFCGVFRLEPPKDNLLNAPIAKVYVLEDVAALGEFGKSYAEDYGMSEEDRAFAMTMNHLVWKNLGHATSMRHPLWDALLVAQIGGDLTQRIWHHGFDIPAWIWLGAAHNAEIEVFGEARVEYIAPDKYGRKAEAPKLKGLSVRDIKLLMKEMYAEHRVPQLRNLFNRPFNEIDADATITAIIAFHFFLEKHREPWMKFLRDKPSPNLQERFSRIMKVDFSTLDHELETWVKETE
ncbi:MAG: hypothetical protein R3F20_08675 [Planctomycetota bacterium]